MVSLQPKLSLKVAQRQILTPGLMQMVSVLALNKLELKDMIQAEIAENPVLEELEESVPMLDHVPEPDQAAPAETKPDPFDEIDFGSYFQEYLDPGFRSPQSFEVNEKPSLESYLSKPGSLEDHLSWQLGSLTLSPAVRDATEYIVGNLNEDGYLAASEEDLLEGYHALIAQHLAAHPEMLADTDGDALLIREEGTLAHALTIVRGLDPVGVAAVDLRGCLLAQIHAAQRISVEQQSRREQWRQKTDPERGVTRSSEWASGEAGFESRGSFGGEWRSESAALVSNRDESNGSFADGLVGDGSVRSGSVYDGLIHDGPIHPAEAGELRALRAQSEELVESDWQDGDGLGKHDGRFVSAPAAYAFAPAAYASASSIPDPQTAHEPSGQNAHDGREPAALTADEPAGAGMLRLVERIVNKHLLLLQKRDLRELAKAAGTTVEQASLAFDYIRTLDPRPGQRFHRVDARLIEPDVAFVKRDDEYVAVMDDESVPSLRLNQGYRKLMKQPGAEKDVKDYVKERYRSALQLMRNIEQRKNTILRTCEVIVRRQQEFLERGVEALRPMMIKEVAEEIGVHPSTVSRAVSNKYVHTPQGVYELRFFFTEGVNGPEGSGTPLLLLKRKVKKLIEEEDPRKPLTDELITHMLQSQGIDVTRRTVAKYREDLRIPSTHQRRVRD